MCSPGVCPRGEELATSADVREHTVQPSIPRRRWRIALLLGLGVLVNYFDRVNLSVSHGALTTTFGISDITFGYLLGAYNWTYAPCQLPIGVVLDQFGLRRGGRLSRLLRVIGPC